jgi:hypothetical protein
VVRGEFACAVNDQTAVLAALLSLDLPGGLKPAGRIIGAEDRAEPGASTARERITGPQQQPPLGPDRIRAASAPAAGLLRQALADPGEHVVAEEHEVEGVHRDGGAGKPHPQRLAEDRGRVDRDDLHPEPPLEGRADSQFRTPSLSRPSTVPPTWPVSGSTIVVIHGSYLFHALVAGSRKNRTDR